MAENCVTVEIITPERVLLREQAESLIVPASGGYMGVLPGHAPLVTKLGIGVAGMKQGGKDLKVAISGGFMEVSNNRAVLLADVAEKAEEIDTARAERALARAEHRLHDKDAGVDLLRAELAMRRAIARMQATRK